MNLSKIFIKKALKMRQDWLMIVLSVYLLHLYKARGYYNLIKNHISVKLVKILTAIIIVFSSVNIPILWTKHSFLLSRATALCARACTYPRTRGQFPARCQQKNHIHCLFLTVFMSRATLVFPLSSSTTFDSLSISFGHPTRFYLAGKNIKRTGRSSPYEVGR